MDPNANLREQAGFVAQADLSRLEKARLRELREALQGWINCGGFAPDWTLHPAAAKAYRVWIKNRIKFQDLYR